jgi:hypothetical protein
VGKGKGEIGVHVGKNGVAEQCASERRKNSEINKERQGAAFSKGKRVF